MKPSETLSLLADAGASFVLLRPRSKAPLEAGWTHKPRTLGEALTHLDAGGNVGVAGGVVTLDFDCDAAAVPELPTLRKWRKNAPDRVSYAVRCTEPLPSRKHARIEVKATGTQALWCTVHPSGAVIQTAGDAILTMTPAQVWALWNERTGLAPVRESTHVDKIFPSQAKDVSEIGAAILRSRQGSEFAALYAGQHNYRSHSEADAALLRLVAWWVKGDTAAMLAIWQGSALWRADRGADYVTRTLQHGLTGCRR